MVVVLLIPAVLACILPCGPMGAHRLGQADGHDGADRLTSATLGEGAFGRSWTDTSMGQLATEQATSGAGTLQDLTYHYYADGHVMERLDAGGAGEWFDYDYADRLRQWTVNQAGQPQAVEKYQYDGLGNLKVRSSNVDPVGDWVYHHDSQIEPLDVLSSVQHGANPAVAPSFDLSGREQIGPMGEQLGYGQWNEVTYLNDRLGDHQRLFTAGGQLAWERSSQATTLAFGDLYKRVTDASGTRHYCTIPVPGSDTVQLEYRPTGFDIYYDVGLRLTFNDRLGSPDVTFDGLDGTTTHTRYAPFGDRRDPAAVGTPQLDTPLPISEPIAGGAFAGHDASTFATLVDMGGRVYDPLEARFVSRDPVVHDVFDGEAWHGFAYVRNNPVSLVDPTGFQVADPGGSGQTGPYEDIQAYDPTQGPASSPPSGSSAPAPATPSAGTTGTTATKPIAPIAPVSKTQTAGDVAIAQYLYWHSRPFGARVEGNVDNAVRGLNNAPFFVQPLTQPFKFLFIESLGSLGMALNPERPIGQRLVAGTLLGMAVIPPLKELEGVGELGTVGREGLSAMEVAARGLNLAAHEAAGGHLLARHVGKTVAELAARLDAQPLISAASTFASVAEAEAGASAVLGARAGQLSSWVSAGAQGRLTLEAPFAGGQVLVRGAATPVAGSAVRLVLEGTGGSAWHIVRGFPLP